MKTTMRGVGGVVVLVVEKKKLRSRAEQWNTRCYSLYGQDFHVLRITELFELSKEFLTFCKI